MTAHPNVVFIVGDTLRRDRVSCYGYERDVTPHLDQFAEEATVYTDAVAQAPWSIPSHASMFTGEYPHEHGATTISPVLQCKETLAAVLSHSGYRTCGVSKNEYIRPVPGFAHGFDEFHPTRIDLPDWAVRLISTGINTICASPRLRRPVEAGFNIARRVGGTGGPLDRTPLEPVESFLQHKTEPFFLFLNLVDIHLPRSPDERYREQFVDDRLSDVTVPTDERTYNFQTEQMTSRQREKMSQLYDADVATMDARFGRVLTMLREHGVFDDTMIVFVSDHGEHLGEFGRIGHQHSVYDSVVAVPMVIKYPGQSTTRTIENQVETRRLFHTILDTAGVRPYPTESLETVDTSTPSYGEFFTPMLDLPKLERDNQAVYNSDLLGQTLSFVRHDGYKLIRNLEEEILFTTPERSGSAVRIEDNLGTFERLKGLFPDSSGHYTSEEVAATAPTQHPL